MAKISAEKLADLLNRVRDFILKDYTPEEIAKELDCSIETVEGLISIVGYMEFQKLMKAGLDREES